MEIIELTHDNNLGYKQFFLKGLIQYPEFFRISLKDELNEPFPTFGMPHGFTLGAINNDKKLMGVVSLKRETENREKLSHKALLFRMYVSAEFSGKGIGDKLLKEVIEKSRKWQGIEQIKLTVVSNNRLAQNLYLKNGFQQYAIERKSIKFENQYFDEDLMVLFLT